VNKDLFVQFALGRDKLQEGKCAEIAPIKKRVVELMSIPQVQGALRYAYKVAELQGGAKEKGEGAAFSAAILPRVAHCDSVAGKLISDNMDMDSSSYMGAGHKAVKEAFESTYTCLGFTCADIGGLLETEGVYHEGAAPCTGSSGDDPSSTSHALRKEAPLFFGALSLMGLHFVFVN